jgi:hypothetical protein
MTLTASLLMEVSPRMRQYRREATKMLHYKWQVFGLWQSNRSGQGYLFAFNIPTCHTVLAIN